MGKVMQIDEHAPAAVKEALDKKELSINQGYQITKQVEDLPEEQREQAAQEALDILKAKRKSRKRTRRSTVRGRSPESSARRMKRRSCWTPQRKMSGSGLNVPA